MFQKGGIKINKTAQQWIPIESFDKEGYIKLKNGKIIKIIKVEPINYNLKSELEKKAILNSYKIFLKTCNFNIQILIQSNKQDLSSHIKQIEKNIHKKENEKIKELGKNYIDYIKNLNSSKKSSSKNFYLIISNKLKNVDSYNKEITTADLKEKYFKIKECLSRCGNTVIEINNKKEVIDIYNSFYNARKNLRN